MKASSTAVVPNVPESAGGSPKLQAVPGQGVGLTRARYYSQAAFKVLVSVQVIVLFMVAGFAASLLNKVQHAAGTTNKNWDWNPAMCTGSRCNTPSNCANCNSTMCQRCDMDHRYQVPGPKHHDSKEESGFDGVHPGDMIVSKADSQGMSACQLHFNVNLNLKWGKQKYVATKVGVDSGVSASAQLASASINTKSVCPTAADFDGDCSYLSAQVWDVKLEEGKFYSTTLFGLASAFMPFWFLMKLISLEPQLVDFVVGKLSCGRMKTEGRSEKLLINFGFLGSSKSAKGVEMAIKELSKHFRFKVASNTLLWPIITLASVEKCPAHLFTELPGLFFYYILSACAICDLVYTSVFYVCFAGADEGAVGCKRLLYAPMFCSTVAALVGFLVVLSKSSWSIVFGFNFSLAFNFEISAELGAFFMLYMLLSVLELVNTMVNISKKVKKVEQATGEAYAADQP